MMSGESLLPNFAELSDRISIRAATGATSTIPIVGIDLESDPVASGWAKSLSRVFAVFDAAEHRANRKGSERLLRMQERDKHQVREFIGGRR